MNLFDRFTSKENLKKAFLYLKQEVEKSNLPLDPIWQPSISAVIQLGDDFFEALQEYLRQNKYQPDNADYIYSPKDNLGRRPICILSLIDRVVYQSLLNPSIMGNAIDKKLFSFCFGHRILGGKEFFDNYKIPWSRFCKDQIIAFKNGYNWRIEFDINSFFESIHIEILSEILKKEFFIQDGLLDILLNQLKTWLENSKTGLGIPQPSYASNVLANAYLYPLDKFMNNLLSDKTFKYFRYADDMVIMAKSADKVHQLVECITIFLRDYNLRLNEKTKIERLKNTNTIQELRHNNPYGWEQKIAELERKIPRILRRIKKGKEVKKTEISNLKYYLKASSSFFNSRVINDVIDIIPIKPSLIFEISSFLGLFLFCDYFFVDKKHAFNIYKRIWRIYKQNALTEWTRFWLIKVLSAPEFAKNHSEFQKELNMILSDKNSKFLRIITLAYKGYANVDIYKRDKLEFSCDDLKRFIASSETPVEKAGYYYFLIYLAGFEDDHTIEELIYEALQSQSHEIQLIGLFIAKKLKMNISREELGNMSRLYLKLPLVSAEIIEKKPQVTESDYLTFEGKIPKDQLQFAHYLGISRSKKINEYNQDKVTKREQRKKINNIINNVNFGKIEKAFLRFLAKDFEPKTKEEIKAEINTKACIKLKYIVQNKLKNTGFTIKTVKGGWGRKSTYQLVYLLTSRNS